MIVKRPRGKRRSKQERAERRAVTGSNLLAKAKDGGTVERDGQEFKVVVLPAKRGRKKKANLRAR